MIRIAAEEAWAPVEILARCKKLLQEKPESWDPGFRSLWGLDATGIARQLVFLSSPGVQVFDTSTAVSLSWEYNDQLIEKVNANPDRFSGLAAIAPQSRGRRRPAHSGLMANNAAKPPARIEVRIESAVEFLAPAARPA